MGKAVDHFCRKGSVIDVQLGSKYAFDLAKHSCLDFLRKKGEHCTKNEVFH